MIELLSKDHSILEKGSMEYRPFGVTPGGERIRDATGVKIRAYVDYLEESMARAGGPEAGERAVQDLCRQLNERIRDPAHHVTPKLLKNVWNSYSYEFVCFLGELCKRISGDPLFSARVGEEKFLSAIIQTLGRPFSVQQIYQRFPHFGEKFSSLILKAEQVTDRSAILSMRYPEEVSRQFGSYRYACADLICQSARAALAAVPEKIHHRKRATIKDLMCIANGDESCTWELQWDPQQRRPAGEIAAGLVGGGLAFMVFYLFLPDVPAPVAVVFAVPAAAAAYLGYRLQILRSYVKAREDLIQEQLQFVEARHEELRSVYLGLEEKVRERTFELERADRHRSMFLSHVSHELRTPLTSIKGFVENLLAGIAGPLPDKHKTYLTRIGVNADRLIRMIANLLDQTRIDQGKIELSPSDIDLRKFASDVIDQLRALATAKGQRLEIRLPESPVTVWADADCLVQIFTNLVHNATKFTAEGGQITVRISVNGRQACVAVTDTGRGIPDEALPTLFSPFSRIGQERGGEKGLGLGLSIVKTLVELHGGRIAVESQSGTGSSFTFTVPLTPAARESEGRGRSGGKRVLVADDDPDILQLLLDRLTTYGYQVETAAAGSMALEAFRPGAFDGLVLDIGMPDLDGLEVLRRIRERDASIPIIMITASGSKERAVQAVHMGAQAYLLKPFEAVQLKEAVERWFGPATIESR
jgi:signal transduction histidine kinase/CheY-like chemotaxis protein